MLRWVTEPAACAAECGLSEAALKQYVNAAPGSGRAMLADWMKANGLTVAPGFVVNYREELRGVASRDLAEHTDAVAFFRGKLCSEHDVSNMVTYTLNCEY